MQRTKVEGIDLQELIPVLWSLLPTSRSPAHVSHGHEQHTSSLTLQVLLLDEEAFFPTWNFSKIVYNKWLQAFENNMSNLYNATLDDYCRAVL
jgi:hypothetical protein